MFRLSSLFIATAIFSITTTTPPITISTFSKEPEVATIDLPKEPESSPKNPVNYASIDLFEVIFKKIDGDAPICSEKVDLKAVFQKIQEYIRCH